MEHKIATESDMIDYLLNTWENMQYQRVFEQEELILYGKASDKIEAFGLVIQTGLRSKLTERGYEVVTAGGFDKWRQSKEEKEAAIYQATMDSTAAAVKSEKHAKHSKYAAYFAIGISLAALAVAAYPIIKSNQISEGVTKNETQQTTANTPPLATMSVVDVDKTDSILPKKKSK